MKRHLSSFFSFLIQKKFPSKDDIAFLVQSPRSFIQGMIVLFLLLVVGLFLALLVQLSALVSTEVPAYGGRITEGVIGAPRFINPLLATTDSDTILTTLIYSGLVTIDDNDTIVPELAKTCTASPDTKAYQCTLKDALTFSNKHPLTSADVLFTFQTKQSLALARDPQSDWGTISVEALDTQTIRISTTGDATSLKQKLTLGIVPKELWGPIPLASLPDSAANMRPIGSGPYRLHRISYTNTIPSDIILKRNPHYARQKPYSKTLVIHSFANQLDLKAALHNHSIDSTSALRGTYIDEQIKQDFSITTLPTTKTVSLFVNQNQSAGPLALTLANLNENIDRTKIIDIIEHGYGIPLIPESTPHSVAPVTPRLSAIPLSIAVQKDEDLVATAQLLSDMLKEFGILSTVNVFDQGTYTDQLQLRSYSFVLATTTSVIPGYQRLIPLYTSSLVHIAGKTVHTPTPSQVRGIAQSFRDANHWYTRTDRVWNWFIYK